MSIKETHRKIHFTPFEIKKGRDVDDSPSPTMTLKTETGALRFSKSLITELNLDGKFVKLYYEPTKRIIGFQFKSTATDNELKSWKLVKRNPVTGTWTVTINKMLNQFNSKPTKDLYSMMPVRKYVDSTGVMNRGDVFYYVQLIDNPDELKKGVGNDTLEDMSTE